MAGVAAGAFLSLNRICNDQIVENNLHPASRGCTFGARYLLQLLLCDLLREYCDATAEDMADAAPDPALERAAILAQKAVRGHQGRQKAETVKLLAEFEDQMKQQRALERRQTEEGMKLVEIDQMRRSSERDLILKKSATFVEAFEESEATRRMNILMATLMKSRDWIKRLRKRLRQRIIDRKEAAEREAREKEERRLAEIEAEKERRAARERKRQAELEELEKQFEETQKEREAKAQESIRLVEHHMQDMEMMHAELGLVSAERSHDSTETKENSGSRAPSEDGTSKNATGSSNGATANAPIRSPQRAAKPERLQATKPASALPLLSPERTAKKRVSWNNTAADLAKQKTPDIARKNSQDKQAEESLADMTAQALVALQETLQVRLRPPCVPSCLFLCRLLPAVRLTALNFVHPVIVQTPPSDQENDEQTEEIGQEGC